MMQEEAPGITDASTRRFDLALFIIHPSRNPAEISAALGLEPKFVLRVGNPRITPKGTALAGNYPDTRWRYVVRHAVTDQYFVEQIGQLVALLAPHKAYLSELRSTGGQTSIIIAFLGDGYFGDQIPPGMLSNLAELGLDLGVECFSVPQL